MAKKNINKEKSELIIISSAALHGSIEDQDKFSFDESTSETKIPGGIGYTGTKYISTSYEGLTGNIESTGAKDGKEQLLAYAMQVDPDNYVGFHLSLSKEFYIVANGKDDDGNLVTSYFVERARLTKKPVQLEEGNLSFSFAAPQAMEFAKEIVIQEFDGNTTPVTTLTLDSSAVQHPKGSYALVVLKDTASQKGAELSEGVGNDYTATADAVTLTVGLASGEKALVIYLKA